MRRVRRLMWVLAVVGLVVVASAPASGQPAFAPMSAERSIAVQSRLQEIDQDRVTAVNQLLAQWQPWVDTRVYDLWDELGPIAMQAPAWQIYGASLAGDFDTMVRILTGKEGAGYYINTLTEPQPKSAVGPLEPNAFGSTADNLVYTPITPCRVLDTRNAGARTGIMTAGSARTFDLEADAFTSGQGVTGPCTGLPTYSPRAWAVTLTVTGYSGNGWLTIWPAGGTEPNASVINYGSAPYAIATGVTLTGCYGCVDDVTVRASAASTHVIIDVLGYYDAGVVSSSAVTRVVGDVQAVPANNSVFIDGGACPAGTRLIGGEVDHNENDVAIAKSLQESATVWRHWMMNNTASPVTATGYSRCLDTPIKLP